MGQRSRVKGWTERKALINDFFRLGGCLSLSTLAGSFSGKKLRLSTSLMENTIAAAVEYGQELAFQLSLIVA